MTNQEQIEKLLKKMDRDKHKPDLHSFKARIKDGVVFVDARLGGIYITEVRDTDIQFGWVGPIAEAAKRLEEAGLDLASVEM